MQCDIVRRSELASGAVHVMYEGCFLAILAAEEANLEELGLIWSSQANVTYSVFWIPSDCSSQCNKLNMYVLFREISWISSRGMRPCL